ncbi:MAG: hypothetical protein PHV06_09845 [bacterium]|nr:hypothetical protein [bacterium]
MRNISLSHSTAIENSGIEIIPYEDLPGTLKDEITDSYERDDRVFEPVCIAVIEPGDIHFDWLGRIMCIYFPKGILPLGTNTRVRMLEPGPIEIIYTLTDGRTKYAFATNEVVFYNKCPPNANAYYTIGNDIWGYYDSGWQDKIDDLIESTDDQVEYGWGSYNSYLGGCDFKFVVKVNCERLSSPYINREVAGKDVVILFEREVGYNIDEKPWHEFENCEYIGKDYDNRDRYELTFKVLTNCFESGLSNVPVYFYIESGAGELSGGAPEYNEQGLPVYRVQSDSEGLARIEVLLPGDPNIPAASVKDNSDFRIDSTIVKSYLITEDPSQHISTEVPCGTNEPYAPLIKSIDFIKTSLPLRKFNPNGEDIEYDEIEYLNDKDNSENNHNNPLLFVKNEELEFKVSFDTDEIIWPGENIWIRVKSGDEENEILDFGETKIEKFTDLKTKKVKFTSINKLPDHVDYYPNADMEFNFYFEFGYETGGEIKWIEGAIIPFKVFIVYKKPVEISFPIDVFVEISCKSARGLNSQDEIVEAEFIKGCGEFAEYNGEKFKYIYPWNWNKINYPLKQFLLDNGGKCGVWSEYLEYLNLIQGIKIQKYIIYSNYNESIPFQEEEWQDPNTGIYLRNLYKTKPIRGTNLASDKEWIFPDHEFILYKMVSNNDRKKIIYDTSFYSEGIHQSSIENNDLEIISDYEDGLITKIGYGARIGQGLFQWIKSDNNPLGSLKYTKVEKN